ncbi:hypothetical protein ALI22I_09840 [Saccharothrix sp. ALI-22-I]|uniref:condensation domain-containing protein n=1 Tax=Saccharothrix sp. ALI-22-I TaxID=1933778 RepID=UPI00097BC64F|nr:condensation domain-containing protein [Saccharothrix sp. ALI-22-I]ONI91073.1 hypothetical protein ALI22I_09840 [Saccharothrix sp. ALI-22-I]
MSATTTLAPLSSAQEALWLVDQAAPGSPAYNVPLLTRWREPVDIDALSAALTRVVERHEVLRTAYRLDGDRPVQLVLPPAPVAVRVFDASDASDVDAGVAAEARAPFDLAGGPVLRCAVWRGVPGGDLVLITVHHIAIDGWSLVAFYGELAEAYRGGHNLPAIAVQYGDFARWERDTSDPGRAAERAAELVGCADPVLLDGVRPVPARPDGTRPGTQVAFPVSAELWAGVHDVARVLRVTPFVVLHAALQVVVARRSGRTDFLLGAVTANRPRPDVEGLVGYFVNTVPLRCHLSPEWTFRRLAVAFRAEAYRSLSHQSIPLRQLVSEVAAARTGGHTRLVEICLAVQNTPAPRADVPWGHPVVLPTGTAKFDLLVVVEETPDGVRATIEHDTDRYPDEVRDGVVADFLATLTTVTADPDVPLAALATGDAVPVTAPVAPTATATAVPSTAVPSTAVASTAGEVSAGDLRRAAALFTEALADLGRGDVPAAPDAHFFSLGGHSLLAVTMLNRAARRLGVVLRPAEFLADPTVAGLGRMLAAAPAAGRAPTADDGRLPATSAQQRFWFLDRVAALRVSYLVPTVLELTGEVDVPALRDAVDRVLAHHPALRSRFVLDRKQRRVFYRTDGAPATTELVDAADWSAAEVRDHVAEVCWAPFDLAADPPARARLITARGRVLFVLVLHHIAADGWSRQLLLEQIGLVHRTGALPEPGHAVPPTAEEVQAQTRDLLDHLRGAPVDVVLPHTAPRPEIQSTLAHRVSTTLDDELSARLRAAADGDTPFTVTAALLAVALGRRSGQRDFLFAFPWAGRDAPDSADAVAMLVNTLVLRVDLRAVRTWRDVLAAVRNSAAVSYRDAAASFDVLAAHLHPDRDLGRPPLTPVYLAAQDGPDPVPDLPCDVRHLPLDPLHVKYEVELTVTGRDRLTWELSHLADLVNHEAAAGLLADLTAAAGDLAADPDAAPWA